MAEIFVISDTHFNHSNILKFKDDKDKYFRGDLFEDVHHMNETIIENWNKVVTPQDKVYHLGDVFFGRRDEADKLLARLNGKKRLIVGNHDTVYGTNGNPLHHHFQKIYMWKLFKEFDMCLTHVPIHRNNFRKVNYNVHGHIHQRPASEQGYINVSVERVKYTPVPIEEVIKRYKDQWKHGREA